MYRRRNVNLNKQKEEDHQKKEVNEPKTKVVYVPRNAGTFPTIGSVPMLNTLRDVNYLRIPTESTSVPVDFDVAVEVLLSSGYLNINFDHYLQKTYDNVNTLIADGAPTNWKEMYTATTSFTRTTLLPGDVIFAKGTKSSIGFLVTDILKDFSSYNPTTSNDSENFSGTLSRETPDGSESVDEQYTLKQEICQSLTTCSGTMIPFSAGVKVDHLFRAKVDNKECFVSCKANTQEIRNYKPTNLSIYTGTDTTNWTAPRKEYSTSIDPTVNDLLTEETAIEKRFGALNTIYVQGYWIYLKSSEEVNYSNLSKITVGKITGDVIRTGPIKIGTVGAILKEENRNLCQCLSIGDFIFKKDTANEFQFQGNSTSTVFEPMNSQSYEANYGNAMGTYDFVPTEIEIYSMKCFVKKQA